MSGGGSGYSSGGGCVLVLVFKHQVAGPNLEEVVGACHKASREDVAPGLEGGVENEGESGEAFLLGAGEMGHGVNWQVLSDRGGWNGSSPVEGEVELGEVAGKVPE